MTQAKFTPRQMLLNEIACAMTDHTTEELGAGHFVDLTTGEVTFIQGEYMLEDVTPDELTGYRDWEQEQIKEYAEHDLIRIDCVPSNESFRVMERFVESRPEREQKSLYVALANRHPFREFRFKVERMGILQEWYDFKNAAEHNIKAEEEGSNNQELLINKTAQLIAYSHQVFLPRGRFIFLRSILTLLNKDNALPDKEMAEALGISHTYYRVNAHRIKNNILNFRRRLDTGEHLRLDDEHQKMALRIGHNNPNTSIISKSNINTCVRQY